MARLLLFVVIGFVVYYLVRGFKRPADGAGGSRADAAPGAGEPEDMVACSICGVHMPRSESRRQGDRITCLDPAACKHAK